MQPHVNLGVRFRTHFQTFGPSKIRFKKAKQREERKRQQALLEKQRLFK
jgi:hypothetical protein